eukprot:COSAG06_NODE_26151_length_620_cov_1.560461_1_plen_42_part_10
MLLLLLLLLLVVVVGHTLEEASLHSISSLALRPDSAGWRTHQ